MSFSLLTVLNLCSASTPSVKVPPFPDVTDSLEKHEQHLELWCQRWYDNGAASLYNREYHRPQPATRKEVKEDDKDETVFWWCWICR
jgi:hypothetical protein